MEKQAFALVRSLKHFRVYIGYSRIIAYVPHSVVKDILAQQDCLGPRGRWVSKIQEYDLEIKPTKLIKVTWTSEILQKIDNVWVPFMLLQFPKFWKHILTCLRDLIYQIQSFLITLCQHLCQSLYCKPQSIESLRLKEKKISKVESLKVLYYSE